MTAADSPPHPDRPQWGWAGWGLVVLSFLIGFANFPLQVVGRDFTHLPGDAIDNRLNLCVLEHGYRYLGGKVERFWDIATFYPSRGVTAWSDAHLGMLPLYAALRVGGLSPERAFQGWFLVPFVLNFAAAVWAARQLRLGPTGSAVAGYVFAYGLPLVAQLPHTQLYPRFLVPPALALAWDWLRAPRESWRLAAVAGCVVCQTYTSVYIGYFLGLTLVAGGVLALVVARGRVSWRGLLWPNWRVWLARAAAAAGAAAAVYPLVAVHRSNGSEVPENHVLFLSPRPLAWITPPGVAAAFPEIGRYTKMGSMMAGAGEEQLSPGVLSLGAVALGLPVALVVLVRRGSDTQFPAAAVAVGAWTAVLLALLVTKFGENDPTWLYRHLLWVPGAGGIRAPSRVVLVLLFPVGVALGALCDVAVGAAARRSRGAARVVAAVAVGAVAVDQRLTAVTGDRTADWVWGRNSLAAAVERQGQVAAVIRQHPNPKLVYVFPSVAELPGAGGWSVVQLDAMRAAQDAGLPTANGLSGHAPTGWNRYPDWKPPATYRELLTWLLVNNRTPPEVLAGLVLIGEPIPDADEWYEVQMRVRFPPRRLGGGP